MRPRGGGPQVREETGDRPGRLDHLRASHATGWERNRHRVVFAAALEAGERARDAGESDVSIRRLPVEATLERARESPVAGWLLTPLLVARDADLL